MTLPSSGPAMITVGIAMRIPNSRVSPRSALRAEIATSGPRVRRHEPVQHRQAGQRRDADLHQRNVACAAATSRTTGTRSTTPISKNSGSPMRAADAGHRPGQGARADAADDRVDDLVGAAGVGQQPADHRAERDEQPDARHGRAEPLPKLSGSCRAASAATSPSTAEPRISARNGCILTTVMSTTTAAMPSTRGEDELGGSGGGSVGGDERNHDHLPGGHHGRRPLR